MRRMNGRLMCKLMSGGWLLLALWACGIGTFLQAADRKGTTRDDGTVSLAAEDFDVRDSRAVAQEVDRLILQQLQAAGQEPAALTRDEDFLRRVTLDLVGQLPTPGEVTLFGLNPDAGKRAQLIERLLKTEAYAENWSRYWRDVIFLRATNMRAPLMQSSFEAWMREQLAQNVGWDQIAEELVTATGEVTENGQTALMFAHMGDPAEIAAETSRIFLGIQISCANCHDHPTDQWKREQFHELAAFFPRVGVRQRREENRQVYEVVSVDVDRSRRRGGRGFLQNPERLIRNFDRDRDGRLSRSEIEKTPLAQLFDRLLRIGDKDNDEALTLAELKGLPMPNPNNQPGRGATEYFMPDLSNPTSQGSQVEPAFFATGAKARPGLEDLERRELLARYLTATNNPWFAKAFVNRMWSEMLGQGFSMPVDDLGPDRTVVYPEVLDLLAQGFRSSKYDVQWLLRTIANTQTYQRQIRSLDADQETLPFAAGIPTRLRSDQLYNALSSVLGIDESTRRFRGLRMMQAQGPYGRGRTPRTAFNAVFGFDPSTPQDDVMGEIPQALFLMNSPLVGNMMRADGNTRLARILRDYQNDTDAISELYLLALARTPTENEQQTCLGYITDVGDRREAFEDILWSLINSSEFLTKR